MTLTGGGRGWWTAPALIKASTGAILTTLPVGPAYVLGQSVFAQSTLFAANETNGLYDFAPDRTADRSGG
jgi:hypothetical protein